MRDRRAYFSTYGRETQDACCSQHNGGEKSQRIDLGLALLEAVTKPGEALTYHDIAMWAGCSRAMIQLIERRALRKLRAARNVFSA